jgi:hypothetical protein
VDREAAELPVAAENLYAHALRSLQSAFVFPATAVLDRVIALLQRLRKSIGGAQASDNDDGKDRPGARKDRPQEHLDGKAAVVEAGPPTRRRRDMLVYFGVFLLGGMGAGVLAYYMPAELLNRWADESMPSTAMKSKKTDVAATVMNAEEPQAERGDTEEKLEEAQAGRTEAENRLEEAQSQRIEAEKKLAKTIADYKKSSAEKQERLDDAEKRIGQMFAAERAAAARPPAAANRTGSDSRHKTGNCVISPDNPGALRICLENFNR